MAYCDAGDLAERLTDSELAQLADHDGDGTADADVILRATTDAAALIDSYLGMRYVVPLATVPDAVKTVALNVSIYFLHLFRRAVPEDVRKQHDDDLRWLRDVAAGKVSLGVDTIPAQATNAPGVNYHADESHFGRDKGL